MTAGDVVFSLEAAYAVPLAADSLQLAGKKLTMAPPDPLTVVLTFPLPSGRACGMLDNLSVLPKHRLEAALEERRDRLRVGPVHAAGGHRRPRAVRAVATTSPGQRMVFARNPRYWRKDEKGDAAAVPRSADDRDRSPSRTPSCCA